MPNATFADVNGQHISYSVQGSGKPLILLHGGIDPDSIGSNRAGLAKGRHVIAVHGRRPARRRDRRFTAPREPVRDRAEHLSRWRLWMHSGDVAREAQ